MARILKMNSRYMAELSSNDSSPSPLEQILLLTGFAASTNLLKIAEALGRRDYRVLTSASERNAKLNRLRQEIWEQVAAQKAKVGIDSSASLKLTLIASIALLFERMGAKTVELAELCDQVIRNPVPSRVTEVKKLMEHCVHIADAVGAALVYEQPIWAKAALEEERSSSALIERIERDLDSLRSNKPDAVIRATLLGSLASKTYQVVDESKEMATKVLGFLEEAEIHV